MDITQQHIENFKEYNKNANHISSIYSLSFIVNVLFLFGFYLSSKTILQLSQFILLTCIILNFFVFLVTMKPFSKEAGSEYEEIENDVWQNHFNKMLEKKYFISYDLEQSLFMNSINNIFTTRSLLLIGNIALLYYFNYPILTFIFIVYFFLNNKHNTKYKYLAAIYIAKNWKNK